MLERIFPGIRIRSLQVKKKFEIIFRSKCCLLIESFFDCYEWNAELNFIDHLKNWSELQPIAEWIGKIFQSKKKTNYYLVFFES